MNLQNNTRVSKKAGFTQLHKYSKGEKAQNPPKIKNRRKPYGFERKCKEMEWIKGSISQVADGFLAGAGWVREFCIVAGKILRYAVLMVTVVIWITPYMILTRTKN